MRPVNLIPPEERHGERAPLRRGPLAYVLVGGLALAFVVVLVTVLLNNRVVERESELAAARAELERATAEAEALAPYAQFVAAQQQREATVVSLADSRFDWERVLRELALVITDDVWLLKLTGSASGGADSPLGGEVAGPSLAIKGCGRDHKAVARFIAALQDIDGVTRVGLADSVRAGIDDEGGGGGSGGDSTCVGKGMPATFNALATFDAVTPSEQAEGGAAPEPPAEPEDEATASAQNGSSGGGAANAVVPGVAP